MFLLSESHQEDLRTQGFESFLLGFLALFVLRLFLAEVVDAHALELHGLFLHHAFDAGVQHGFRNVEGHLFDEAVEELLHGLAAGGLGLGAGDVLDDGGLHLLDVFLTDLLGEVIGHFGLLAGLDFVHLDGEGDGLSGQRLVGVVVGELDRAGLFFADLGGLHEGFEVGKGLTLTEGHTEVFALHVVDLVAFLVGAGVVHIDGVAVLRQAVFGDFDEFGHAAAEAFDDFVDVVIGHVGLGLIHFEAVVVGEFDVGQHVEGDGALEFGVAGEGFVVVHFHAGNGGQVGILENLLEKGVDLVLRGVRVDVFGEALFHHGGGHLALAETGKDEVLLITGDGGVDGGVHVIRAQGEGDCFPSGGNVFNDKFHGGSPWEPTLMRVRTDELVYESRLLLKSETFQRFILPKSAVCGGIHAASRRAARSVRRHAFQRGR